MNITTAHGGGGKLTSDLIENIFLRHFSNSTLNQLEDAAILRLPSSQIAFTTDSFVVTPLFFPGGDIGRLAVCGTVNDLLMRGATPKYLSAGFILEEGLSLETLDRVASSMAEAAAEAGVQIVTGDTKVVEGSGGLYINTSGIGILESPADISVHNAAPGDAVVISGPMGNHHACILSARMDIENSIHSDCAPLVQMVHALIQSGLPIHTLRDITRGGLASVLHEIAMASRVHIALDGRIPLADDMVQGFCDILGLEPIYMGNEGKLAMVLPMAHANAALAILRACPYGSGARMIGEIRTGTSGLSISTQAGGTRSLTPLLGEGLPRIC